MYYGSDWLTLKQPNHWFKYMYEEWQGNHEFSQRDQLLF